MKTVQISDQVASLLTEMASKKHISTSTLIEQLIEHEKKSSLLTDVIKDLPTINAFKGDPVEIQRKMRNEWD
ncbi:MAG: hypothetical protein GQ532_16850 [Methylomarinum sp.]|nr:hypothetical protein [Methylomarinum sp.]